MQKILKVLIRDDLHKEFKVACAQNGQSIKDALIDLLKYYVITTNTELKLKDEKHN